MKRWLEFGWESGRVELRCVGVGVWRIFRVRSASWCRRHALRVRYGRCVFLCVGGEVELRALGRVPVLTSSYRRWLRGCCRCSGRVRGGWWSTSGRGC